MWAVNYAASGVAIGLGVTYYTLMRWNIHLEQQNQDYALYLLDILEKSQEKEAHGDDLPLSITQIEGHLEKEFSSTQRSPSTSAVGQIKSEPELFSNLPPQVSCHLSVSKTYLKSKMETIGRSHGHLEGLNLSSKFNIHNHVVEHVVSRGNLNQTLSPSKSKVESNSSLHFIFSRSQNSPDHENSNVPPTVSEIDQPPPVPPRRPCQISNDPPPLPPRLTLQIKDRPNKTMEKYENDNFLESLCPANCEVGGSDCELNGNWWDCERKTSSTMTVIHKPDLICSFTNPKYGFPLSSKESTTNMTSDEINSLPVSITQTYTGSNGDSAQFLLKPTISDSLMSTCVGHPLDGVMSRSMSKTNNSFDFLHLHELAVNDILQKCGVHSLYFHSDDPFKKIKNNLTHKTRSLPQLNLRYGQRPRWIRRTKFNLNLIPAWLNHKSAITLLDKDYRGRTIRIIVVCLILGILFGWLCSGGGTVVEHVEEINLMWHW